MLQIIVFYVINTSPWSATICLLMFIKARSNFTGPRLSNGALAFRWGVQEAFNLALNYVLMSETRKTLPVRAPVISVFIIRLFRSVFAFIYMLWDYVVLVSVIMALN